MEGSGEVQGVGVRGLHFLLFLFGGVLAVQVLLPHFEYYRWHLLSFVICQNGLFGCGMLRKGGRLSASSVNQT